VHAGEPLHEADDYFGTAVVVAKRLCDGSLQLPVAALLNRRTTSAADGSPATSRFLNRVARAYATSGSCDGQPDSSGRGAEVPLPGPVP